MNENETNLLNFIIEHKRANDGNSPTFGEMSEGMGINRATLHKRIRMLERGGYISRTKTKAICLPLGVWTLKDQCHESANVVA